MSRDSCRGASFDRSKLNAVRLPLLLDINVQFSGAETIEFRQYLHTRTNGMIDLVSTALSARAESRTIRERISGGNLFTGRSAFCNEEIRFRRSRASVSRFSTYTLKLDPATQLDGIYSLLIARRQ